MNFIGVSVWSFKNPITLNFYVSKYLCNHITDSDTTACLIMAGLDAFARNLFATGRHIWMQQLLE